MEGKEAALTSAALVSGGKQNKFGANKHPRRNIRALNNDLSNTLWKRNTFSVRYGYEEFQVPSMFPFLFWGIKNHLSH